MLNSVAEVCRSWWLVAGQVALWARGGLVRRPAQGAAADSKSRRSTYPAGSFPTEEIDRLAADVDALRAAWPTRERNTS